MLFEIMFVLCAVVVLISYFSGYNNGKKTINPKPVKPVKEVEYDTHNPIFGYEDCRERVIESAGKNRAWPIWDGSGNKQWIKGIGKSGVQVHRSQAFTEGNYYSLTWEQFCERFPDHVHLMPHENMESITISKEEYIKLKKVYDQYQDALKEIEEFQNI